MLLRKNFFPSIRQYIESVLPDVASIAPARKQVLDLIRAYIQSSSDPQLIFICTHNSRRSHFGQIWAKVMADYMGVELATFSGGTEATAFHPNAIDALREIGFQIEVEEAGENPVYAVRYADELPLIRAFSKRYDDSSNPQSNFAAVMTCTEADAACPFVAGAAQRISLPYQDPKLFDHSPQAAEAYRRRCRQIATEMKYLLL